jgi:tRNA (cytidine/uridine-2'-O-)-methyltransferase
MVPESFVRLPPTGGMEKMKSLFQMVLLEPEIPANTGSLGRTCVATHTPLHLVGKLGFSLENKYLKRAGLDYWSHVQLQLHHDWQDFEQKVRAQSPSCGKPGRFILFSKKAEQSFWDFTFQENDFLIFGKETQGLPPTLLDSEHPCLRIPTPGPVRSLNLAVAASLVLYEALRQTVRNPVNAPRDSNAWN